MPHEKKKLLSRQANRSISNEAIDNLNTFLRVLLYGLYGICFLLAALVVALTVGVSL